MPVTATGTSSPSTSSWTSREPVQGPSRSNIGACSPVYARPPWARSSTTPPSGTPRRPPHGRPPTGSRRGPKTPTHSPTTRCWAGGRGVPAPPLGGAPGEGAYRSRQGQGLRSGARAGCCLPTTRSAPTRGRRSPFSNRIEDGRAATLARPVAGAAVRRGSCIPGPVRSKPWAALRAGRSQDRRRRVDRLPPSRCGAVDDGTERGIVCLGALTERLHQAGPERFEIANRLVDLLHPLGEP